MFVVIQKILNDLYGKNLVVDKLQVQLTEN